MLSSSNLRGFSSPQIGITVRLNDILPKVDQAKTIFIAHHFLRFLKKFNGCDAELWFGKSK